MMEGWSKKKKENGVAGYFNQKLNIMQCDHPEYVRIMEELFHVNSVKYAAYRTACKLRRLQLRLKFHEASIQCISSVFDSAGLRNGENDDSVPAVLIERIVNRILKTSYLQRPVDTVLYTDLVMNLIFNVLDLKRTGELPVLGVKVVLLVLGSGRLQEKYRYLFAQIADHNNCCTRRRLSQLLNFLSAIAELLSERVSFGKQHVTASVDSCFREVRSCVGITEDDFMSWLMKEPQTLVWWSTLVRFTAAEHVCHDVKCCCCRQHPIIGLRYQCLRCLRYDLCQDCFLHARISKKHRLTHPMQEYCQEASSGEWRRTLVKMLKTHLCIGGGGGGAGQRFLAFSQPLSDGDMGKEEIDMKIDEIREEADGEDEMCSRTVVVPQEEVVWVKRGEEWKQLKDNVKQVKGSEKEKKKCPDDSTVLKNSPRHQISSVILQLEEGQRDLTERVPPMGGSSSDVLLEKHLVKLQQQIDRLKVVLKHLNSSAPKRPTVPPGRGLPRLESTPIVGDRGLWLNLSPIICQLRPADQSAILDNKENHMTENPVTPIVTSLQEAKCGTNETPARGVLVDTNSQGNISMDPTSNGGPLPSFTEVNFSDLSSWSPTLTPPEGGTSPLWKEEARRDGDEGIEEVKHELKQIMMQLDDIFPHRISDVSGENVTQDGCQVLAAAYEVADAVSDYVSLIARGDAR